MAAVPVSAAVDIFVSRQFATFFAITRHSIFVVLSWSVNCLAIVVFLSFCRRSAAALLRRYRRRLVQFCYKPHCNIAYFFFSVC